MKCFILEYLVLDYALPINSMLYIWSLSIFMATVATVIYLRLQVDESTTGHPFPPSAAIWCVCLIGILLVIVAGFSLERLDLLQIPALLSILLGFAYCAQGLLEKKIRHIFSAFGWWLGAAILFRQDSINGLLYFALFILLFTVVPTFSSMIKRRRELNRAMQGLDAQETVRP
jgi:hypothetical protein